MRDPDANADSHLDLTLSFFISSAPSNKKGHSIQCALVWFRVSRTAGEDSYPQIQKIKLDFRLCQVTIACDYRIYIRYNREKKYKRNQRKAEDSKREECIQLSLFPFFHLILFRSHRSMWRSYKAETPDFSDETQEVDLNVHGSDGSDSEQEERKSRSASVTSASSVPEAPVTLRVPTTKSNATSPTPSTGSNNFFIAGMFDGKERSNREAPPMPSTEGVEYPRAASWAAGNCTNVLNDDKGKQLFRVFLFQSLAEENLGFLEAMERLKKMKNGDEKVQFAKDTLNTYQGSINLSSGSMKALRNAINTETLDPEEMGPAIKEVKRLLENDQFPRFRRSELYLQYLEELLPRSYAEKWAQSFEGLLNNHVGRHHFRLFLRSIHAEENLRFWEAVVEFRSTRHKASAMNNLGRVILNTYLAEGTANEVFLPFGVRQVIERRIQDNNIDITLFDEAIKHVEQVLRNDPYVRFLQSAQYNTLLGKLNY
ncbi:hypothetical protein L5515_014593 [Caenorhabditis briggsae]|uniref:RGS domain-containing protein n=1 Tax=Caenorhabditis briggsae TaxID=6238 RepID=A0AAE9J7R0_CAEBR|nr:hypothetical protein L5515_014593 [Caenorhabditis briggsae]